MYSNNQNKAIVTCLKAMCFLILSVLFVLSESLQAQNTQVQFGQNRVEYKNFDWSFYDHEKYRVYFYLGGQDLGKFVIDIAEQQFDYIEKVLEYELDEPVQILVFTDLNDIYQTNIDFESQSNQNYNPGGSTKITKGRLFLYFNGNHAHLEKQLKEGLTAIFIHKMLVGGDLQDMIQYSVIMNFPDWYIEGLVQYFGNGWGTDEQAVLKDFIQTKKKQKFSKFTLQNPAFAGRSFWHFIDKVYGHDALINLLYLVRVNRSIESGFQFVTGKSKKELFQQWYNFYKEGFDNGLVGKQSISEAEQIGRNQKKRYELYQLKVAPDESFVAYVRNFLGRYHLRVMDAQTGKQKTILRGGFKSYDRILDKTFPILDWMPDAPVLGGFYEKKDKIYYLTYDPEKKELKKVKIEKFQKINDFAYSTNGESIVLSANKKGKSDLYLLNTPSQRVTPLTNDIYDDLDPAFIQMGKRRGVAFVSNRPNDTLLTKASFKEQLGKFELFFYEFKKGGNRLIQLTNDSIYYPRSPQYYNSKQIRYLNNTHGAYNQYLVRFDSSFVKNDSMVTFRDSVVLNARIDSTNDTLVENIELIPIYKYFGVSEQQSNLSHSIVNSDASESDNYYELYKNNGRYQIVKRPFKGTKLDSIDLSFKSSMLFKPKVEKKQVVFENKEGKQEEKATGSSSSYYFETSFDTLPSVNVDYDFVTPFDNWDEEEDVAPTREKKNYLEILTGKKEGFKRKNVQPYRVIMSIQSVTSQMDNSIMFTPYSSDGQPAALSPFIKVTLSDLFEDYLITGGMRVPTRLNTGEYFVSYEARKKRLDKRLTAYRKSDLEDVQFAGQDYFIRVSNHILEGRLLWPFSTLSSVRLYGGARHDFLTFKATDLPSLFTQDLQDDKWVFSRAEYVYDNSLELHTNIRTGIRAKFFSEHQRKLNEQAQHITIFGADMRFYQRIHRLMILANRLAVGQSLGPNNIMFVLGGADNWLFSQREDGTPVASDMNYQYQSYVNHLRGFKQNVSNGNKYVIYNAEVRLPIVKYLNLSWKSKFLQDLQFVGFGDIGATWTGPSLFSEENTMRTITYDRGSVAVVQRYYQDPIFKSFGTGVRSSLFGYFLKVDIGWPVVGTEILTPKGMFSLILDF